MFKTPLKYIRSVISVLLITAIPIESFTSVWDTVNSSPAHVQTFAQSEFRDQAMAGRPMWWSFIGKVPPALQSVRQGSWRVLRSGRNWIKARPIIKALLFSASILTTMGTIAYRIAQPMQGYRTGPLFEASELLFIFPALVFVVEILSPYIEELQSSARPNNSIKRHWAIKTFFAIKEKIASLQWKSSDNPWRNRYRGIGRGPRDG